MTRANRFGGDTRADTVSMLTCNNFTWKLGAHRDGWELLNWREQSSMPGSADYTASSKGYMNSLETIWGDRDGQGQRVAASEDSRLEEWLSEGYHPHPQLKNQRGFGFRVISFQEPDKSSPLGIYILEVPTVLKFAGIASEHVEFSTIEGRLIQEQVFPRNIDCLIELARLKKAKKAIGAYRQIQSGDNLIFTVRYR